MFKTANHSFNHRPVRRCLAVALLLVAWAGAAVAEDAATLYRRGLDELAAGNAAAAVELLEAAAAAEPNNLIYGTDYRQAIIAAAGGEKELYERCLAFFEGLVEQHPEAANAYLNLAFAYVDKIPVEGAITQVILANTSLGHFGSALEREESWLGLYSRGHAYLFWPPIFGRTDDGIADLERAVELSQEDTEHERKPFYARAWAALGDGHWRLDDVEAARSIWQQAAELYPEDPKLAERISRTEREALDAYLEAHYDTTRRVDTHLEEIYGARISRQIAQQSGPR